MVEQKLLPGLELLVEKPVDRVNNDHFYGFTNKYASYFDQSQQPGLQYMLPVLRVAHERHAGTVHKQFQHMNTTELVGHSMGLGELLVKGRIYRNDSNMGSQELLTLPPKEIVSLLVSQGYQTGNLYRHTSRGFTSHNTAPNALKNRMSDLGEEFKVAYGLFLADVLGPIAIILNSDIQVAVKHIQRHLQEIYRKAQPSKS